MLAIGQELPNFGDIVDEASEKPYELRTSLCGDCDTFDCDGEIRFHVRLSVLDPSLSMAYGDLLFAGIHQITGIELSR
ncbi:uncharacterized protein TrAFT101_010775 [Trichoderma asperellum]|uniref:uncharacterized protein n=1 Tax=Trichoderma asperellum TaxID=101201 RepID=UPI00332D35F1|nr:hypothetical protein TrAFT101_010775 [Trichoderma asperellum]